jgi:hypothetical protein
MDEHVRDGGDCRVRAVRCGESLGAWMGCLLTIHKCRFQLTKAKEEEGKSRKIDEDMEEGLLATVEAPDDVLQGETKISSNPGECSIGRCEYMVLVANALY